MEQDSSIITFQYSAVRQQSSVNKVSAEPVFLSVSALTPGSNLLQFYHVFPVMNELQIPWLSANKMRRQLHCNLEVKLLEGSLLQRMVL